MSGVAIGWTYPQALGSWPAVILLLFFGWLEVIYPLASVPAQIAWLVLAWTALTLAGMTLFGRAVWQQHADVFALYFATLGRFAPLGGGPDERRVLLRLPGSGLLGGDATSAAIVAFVMAMLATVLFDGLLGTQAWRLLDRTVGGWFPQLLDRDGYILGTAGLLGVWLMFLGAYWMTCLITARLVRGHPADAIAGLFVLSLVPIAVAYNFAHNFSYLLVQGQGLIPLMSDPLGRGWNLFGTVLYKPDIGIVDARFTWYVAIGAIVVGHVIAVWLAHRAALQAFAELRVAVIATIPLTVLMVIYTAISLSIIAEPLVRFRTPDPSYSLNSILRHGDPQPPPPAVSITTRSPLFSTQ